MTRPPGVSAGGLRASKRRKGSSSALAGMELERPNIRGPMGSNGQHTSLQYISVLPQCLQPFLFMAPISFCKFAHTINALSARSGVGGLEPR
jgi:hypothetical protein